MFINVTSCFFDVYFFIVCSKDQKLSIEYIFVIPSELQEEKHDLIKIRPYTAARSTLRNTDHLILKNFFTGFLWAAVGNPSLDWHF